MAEQTTIKQTKIGQTKIGRTKIGNIADESVPLTFIRTLGSSYLRTTALRCIASIFRHFFFMQYRAAFLPGLIPVSKADHPLDEKIPFLPGKVNIYLDFVAFWIRTIGFLKRRGLLKQVLNFIETMGALYAFAADVYVKNLSTTERPFYIKRLPFLFIHAVDPHLMCVPSLHVMVVIRTYTFFYQLMKSTAEEERYASQAEELRLGALAITEAVLYIKQHSVNCIPAAMYAMTVFDPGLFPPDEAERFASGIFKDTKAIDKDDVDEILNFILSMYRRFLAQFEAGGHWTEPLLDFLRELPLELPRTPSKGNPS